jgi:hypothetical protein
MEPPASGWVLIARSQADADSAYAELRLRTRHPGISLANATSAVIADISPD